MQREVMWLAVLVAAVFVSLDVLASAQESSTLPTTAGPLPLIGAAVAVLVAVAVTLMLRRRHAHDHDHDADLGLKPHQ